MNHRLPKVFTDNMMESFSKKLYESSVIDITETVAQIIDLELHYNGGNLMSEDGTTQFIDKVNSYRHALGSMYQAHRKLTHEKLNEKDYLIKLVCAGYIVKEDSLDIDEPFSKFAYFNELISCVNISETNTDYHQKVVNLANDPAIRNYIHSIPDCLAGVWFSKAILGDKETANKFFDYVTNLSNHGAKCYVYRCLFYASIGCKEKVLEDLLTLKKIYCKQPDQLPNQVEEVFRLGRIHKVLNSNEIAELNEYLST